MTVSTIDEVHVPEEEVARANAYGAAHVADCASRASWVAFAAVTGKGYEPFYPTQPIGAVAN